MRNLKFYYWAKGARVAVLTACFGLMVGTASADATIGAGSTQPAFDEVDSFTVLSHLHSWQALDDDTVIVWATPFRPYLVKLAYPSPDLRFAQVIGVTSFGERVYSRFDAVRIAGFRYPIDSIYKLTRDEARNLVRGS